MAPQKPNNKVKHNKWFLQILYNHSNEYWLLVTCQAMRLVMNTKHVFYFHEAYNLVGKTDIYQEICKQM